MTTALLVLALTFTAGSPASDAFDTGAGSCSAWHGWKVPPSTIRVFRSHKRGSSIKATVERWPFKAYVSAVMASGAWGNAVRESSKIGAIAIKGWAMWMVAHHQRGYSWHGQCYDVTSGDQYIRRDVHPSSHLPVRTMQVVRITWPITLTKRGKHFRTGWSGGLGIDGWHANEDTVRGLALHGLGWRSIVRRIYSNVRIVGDWAHR